MQLELTFSSSPASLFPSYPATGSTVEVSIALDLSSEGDLDLSEDSEADCALSPSLLSTDLGLLSADGDLDLATDLSPELDRELFDCDRDFGGVRDLDLEFTE